MDRLLKTELDIDGFYNILKTVSGNLGGEKRYVEKKGECRFCNNTSPQFKNKAHTFPQALGNNWIYSLDECDACNELFSKHETALVDCVRPILTLGGVKGKRKVPQSGRSGGDNYIKHSHQNGKRHISWRSKVEDYNETVSINPENRILKAELTVPGIPFVPRYAYMALAKMAYAILPTSELSNYTKLRAWLQNPNGDLYFSHLEVLISFTSVGNSPHIVAGLLYQRGTLTDLIPYIVFQYLAGSVCLQINLISDSFDDNVPLLPFGRVKIKAATTIQDGDGKNSIKLMYSEPKSLDWTSNSSQPQPIKSMELKFNLVNTQAFYRPVFRSP